MLIDRLPLQAVVFFVAAAAFSTIYITQPVLPLLADEFGAAPSQVSLTVSAVILGIAVSILPFGILADRIPVQRILLAGGFVVAGCSLASAFASDLRVLIAVRFMQGLFVPALTTCLAAYLARSLPAQKLNVVMGSYISATVAGGLGGRLLSGWLHPPEHWRHAFVTAASLTVIATLIAASRLREPVPAPHHAGSGTSLWAMARDPALSRLLLVGFASFFVFSSVFNFLPFYLTAPPISAPVPFVTALYLSYVLGIVVGPLAGVVSDRFGHGMGMAGGAVLVALGLLLSLRTSIPAVAVALAAVCTGYFSIHASAVGAINQRLQSGRGRANALYVLCYYVGGGIGITSSGFAYSHRGWQGVVVLCIALLAVPILGGLADRRHAGG